MNKIWRDVFILVLLSLVSTFLVWLPFIFGLGKGMLTVFSNYDGPNYVVIAKTFYDKELIRTLFSLPTPLEYFPAHLPGYPLLIRLFNPVLPGTWSMLFTSLFTTALATIFFYLLLLKYRFSSNPFWLSIIFLFLPARWLVVHSVGSPEPLFIFSILASIYFFKNGFDKIDLPASKNVTFDFLLAGLFGALAQITKTPGILIFLSFIISLFWKMYALPITNPRYSGKLCQLKILSKTLPLLLIPFSLIGVFIFYWLKTGDILAYFHSGDNFHLVFPPFQSFVTGRNWIGDFWLEDIVWQYLIGALAVLQLIKLKHYDLATFAGIFFTSTLFIAHRDLSRYSLPLMPFALIAFAPFLEKKEFKIAFFFILIPVYLYTINFIQHNTAPIADWTPYL